MRFAPSGRYEFVAEVLGERGQSLEARARPIQHGFPEDEVRVCFAPPALSAEERSVLPAIPGLRLASSGPPSEDLWLLRASADTLASLAERGGAARTLWAAYQNAHQPPGPLRVMGILNVTPDSFSDGGRFLDPAQAIDHGLKLIAAGADIIDVGGESTRPGAEPVSPERELERVLPVIRALAQEQRALVSIDTTKAEVAEAALDAGARIVNDVSAGRMDPRLLPLVAEREAGIVLMHRQGTPRDMQRAPGYRDVVREVCAHLRERAAAAWKAGIDLSRIALDPGIGFGKRLEDNLDLLRALPELRSLGLPLTLGVSRKSFLGALSGESRSAQRRAETCAAVALGAYLGAEIHRVHDVAEARAVLAIAAALGPRDAQGDRPRGRG